MKTRFARILAVCLGLLSPSLVEGSKGTRPSRFRSAPVFSENTQLVSPIPQHNELFGNHLAWSGEVLAIAAPTEGSPVEAVYVFCRQEGRPGAWEFAARITSSDPWGRYFGRSIVMQGDTLVIGDPGARTQGVPAGAVYVYRRTSHDCASWAEVGRLTAPSPRWNMHFGDSLALENDLLIVGASYDDEFAPRAGSAFVFRRRGSPQGEWHFSAKLTAPEPRTFARFGEALGLDEGRLVVGAPREEDRGAAYVFDLRADGGAGRASRHRIVPYDAQPGDTVGSCVDIEGKTLVLASPSNGEAGYRTGVVHIYRREDTGTESWYRTTKLFGSDSHASQFGCALDLTKERLAVAQITGRPGLLGGIVTEFLRTGRPGGDSWEKTATLVASDQGWGHFYGNDVLITDDSTLVGSPYADLRGSANTGAVYLYRDPDIFEDGFESGDASAWSRIAQ